MKIFLDTASRDVIKKWLPTGLVDGITTNPSHLSKEGTDTKQVLKDICAMTDGPVSIEVVEKAPDDVYRQAKEISSFASNVVVKIPCHKDYYPVIKKLADEEIRMNITLVFSPLQVMFVSKLGAEMISPFLGRWDDIGVSGLELLDQAITIKHQYQFQSQILAASIRSVLQWQQVAQMGVDIATVPVGVFEKAMQHPLTTQGIEMFDADWSKLGKKNLFD